MAVVDFPLSAGNSEDIAAALEAQAASLLAQAERLRLIAERVREEGLRSGGRVVVAQTDEVSLEAKVRDVLTDCELATEEFLCESTGLAVKALRPALAQLEADGKVVSMRRRKETVYAWLFPDGRGDAPANAPRQEGRVMADVARDAKMIATDRGTPVRLVDKQRGRRARSTPGVRHRMKMQDKAYEEQQAAKAERAAKQREKAKQK